MVMIGILFDRLGAVYPSNRVTLVTLSILSIVYAFFTLPSVFLLNSMKVKEYIDRRFRKESGESIQQSNDNSEGDAL